MAGALSGGCGYLDSPLGRVREAGQLGSLVFRADAGYLGSPFGEGSDGWASPFWKAGHLVFCDSLGVGQLSLTSVLRAAHLCSALPSAGRGCHPAGPPRPLCTPGQAPQGEPGCTPG